MVSKIRILSFVGSLRSGGKERRLVELLSYLKSKDNYQLMVVLKHDEIYYPTFFDLGISYQVLKKKWLKKDPTLFYQFYKICKKYKPDIIHVWGRMPAFYSIPTSIINNIPIVNSQITSAPPRINKWAFINIINKINFYFSRIVLLNSKAGLDAYSIRGRKYKVVYNGINLSRFSVRSSINHIKLQYGINTPYTVGMVANISPKKDHERLLLTAKQIKLFREDVTFLLIGENKDTKQINKLKEIAAGENNIIFTGRINNVEDLVNICDICVLFTNAGVHGEGISNSILEYMALGKPVIANDAGGTKEIVYNERNGYLISNESPEQIAIMINDLLNNHEKRRIMGETGRNIVKESFTIEKMGSEFEYIYKDVLKSKLL
jgi:glycosyltransferase involved in cell wall biosynthesis